MGKIKQGILGGFNGTVGTVIGGSWKGIAYMRGKAQSIKNPNTPAQKGHRSKFALVVSFLQQIKPFIDLGYKGASKMSPFNAAMSHIMKDGITGEAPYYAIDFENILLSQGSLAPAKNATATSANGEVNFTWTDNSANGEGSPDDVAMVLLYDDDYQEAIIDTTSATRADARLTIELPAAWNTDLVHPYIAFLAADGASVSDSIHLHSVTATVSSGD